MYLIFNSTLRVLYAREIFKQTFKWKYFIFWIEWPCNEIHHTLLYIRHGSRLSRTSFEHNYFSMQHSYLVVCHRIKLILNTSIIMVYGIYILSQSVASHTNARHMYVAFAYIVWISSIHSSVFNTFHSSVRLFWSTIFFYHNNTVSYMITNLLGNASIEIKKNLMVDCIFSLMSLLVYLNLCVFSMWLVTHMKVKIANN